MSAELHLVRYVEKSALYAFIVVGCMIGNAHGAADSDTPCDVAVVSGNDVSLEHMLNFALCRSPEIRASAAAIRARAAQLGEARSEYWPTLSASSSSLREDTRLSDSGNAGGRDSALTLYGALAWKVFDFGARSARTESASRLLQAAFATRDAAAQRVLAKVVQAYFDAVTAHALVESKAQDQAFAAETLASAERRSRSGEGAQNDVLKARAALSREVLESSRARADYEKSIAGLAYSSGVPAGTRFDVAADDAIPLAAEQQNLAAWMDAARRSHPAIAAARAELDAARAVAVSSRASSKPVIELQANYYANGFPQQGLTSSRQRNTTVALVVSIPVFDGFLAQYRVREAEATVESKEATLADTEQAVLTEVVKVYVDATAAIADLDESRILLETSEASHASSRRRYEFGAADIVELLASQATLADARAERVKSIAEWRAARLRLLALTGTLVDTNSH